MIVNAVSAPLMWRGCCGDVTELCGDGGMSHLPLGVSECLFCRSDLAQLKDADTVAVSMKFRSGAVVTVDVSQHCTKTCDHRLEVRSCCSVESVATPRTSTKPLKPRVLFPVCCLPCRFAAPKERYGSIIRTPWGLRSTGLRCPCIPRPKLIATGMRTGSSSDTS